MVRWKVITDGDTLFWNTQRCLTQMLYSATWCEVYSKTRVNNNIYEGKYTTASNSSAAFQPQMNKTFKHTLQSSLSAYPLCGRFPTSDYKLWLLTYLLTPRSRVLLEKLTRSQLVKKFPMEPEVSLPHLQVLTTRPYSEPDQSSSCPTIPLSEGPFQNCTPIDVWIFQVFSFPQVFPPKPCIQFSPSAYMLHAPPI